MTEIAILIPVLNRPQNAAPVVASIRDAQTVDTEIVFLVSPGDTDGLDATRGLDVDTVCQVSWEPGAGDYARKINHGYRLTDAPYVFTAADDLRFEAGWDVACLNAIDLAPGFGVCGTNDLGNPMTMKGRHSTHSLVSRAYLESPGATFLDGPGVVLHEGYDHQQVDVEMVVAAQERHMWTWVGSPAVEHLHPFWHKGDTDATYEKALRDGRRDSGKYRQRYRTWSQQRRRGRLP